MGTGQKRRRQGVPLQIRVAVFVSLSVFAGAAILFTVTVVASRSWVSTEQRDLLITDARGHAALIARVDTDISGVEDTLAAVDRTTRAAVELNGRWYGAPRRLFETLIDPSVTDEIETTGISYRANATADASLIALPIVVGGIEGRYFELADRSVWIARRARTQRLVVVSAILLAVFAAAAGAVVGRRLTRPLVEAAAAARKIAAGGLSTRLPETRDPTLADLTNTFNEMVETLAARTASDRRFNSDVSHELRSPLTTLVASISVLQSRRHELSPANRTVLDLLDADIQRFARLVDDLLEMSRFDGDAASMLVNKVNVSEFLEAVAMSTGYDDLNLVVSPMLRVFEIELDKRRIARVLTNLIDNAYAHGRPPVWLNAIELPPGDRSPTHVRIAVEDRGGGIDLDRADELFERFNRGTRQSRSNGSGLGLALAREHVRLHGGTISFAPPPRGLPGTCIVVVLPLRARDAGHSRPTTLTP